VLVRGDDPVVFRQSIKYLRHGPFGPHPVEETVASESIIEPPIFLLVGRALVAIAGTVAIAFMFLLLREFMPAPAALAGAAWFGAIPTLVEYSHFVVNDIPMMLVYTAMFWCTVRWWRSGRDPWMYAAGALVGVVCSFKTTGILALGYPALVLLVSPRSPRAKLVLLGAISLLTVLTFHVLSPAMLGKYDRILANLHDQERFYKQAYPVATVTSFDHLLNKNGFGYLAPILALLGTAGAAFDRANRRILLATFVYLATMLAFFGRYTFQPVRSLLPLFPLIVLLASYGVVRFVASGRAPARWQKILAGGLLVVLAVQFSARAWAEQRAFLGEHDSRLGVIARLKTLARPGESIAVPETLAFHPRTLADSCLPIQVVPTGDRDGFLAADWVVIPVVVSKDGTDLPRFFAKVADGLVAQGRTPLLRIGSRPITAGDTHWRGGHGMVAIYPPLNRAR
jgi:hypothetical protein